MEFALPNVSPVGTMAKEAKQLKKLASQDLPFSLCQALLSAEFDKPPTCDYFPQIFSPSCQKDKKETNKGRTLTFLLHEKCGQTSGFLLFHVWLLNFFVVSSERSKGS